MGEGRSVRAWVAEPIVAAEGERALTTRRIAQDIGHTSGTLYNVFKDRDDLILALNGATLDELFAAVSGSCSCGR